ncbi:hypothetical protein KYB31_06460 [Clostridium felsineum]|nr:hypothetical protein [Clostridium felsineum]MCR3758637.1 hypothetical protein [Clostridium felsineum]
MSIDDPVTRISLRVVLISFPILSINLIIKVCKGEVTIENNGDKMVVNP